MSSTKDIELPLLSHRDSVSKKQKYHTISDDVHLKMPSKTPDHTSHFVNCLNYSLDLSKYSPRASFFKWLTFTDMLPYVRSMNKMLQKFEINDMPNPEYGFNVESKLIQLDYHWTNELKREKPTFYRALCKTFVKEIIQALILVFIDNTTKVYYSIYMGRIINTLTSKRFGAAIESGELVFSATCLSVLVFLSIFIKNWAFFTVVSNVGRARLAISGILYKKLNSTSLTSLHEIKLGKVINLLGNDLNDLQGLNNVFAMIVNPYMIGLGIYMMWGYFGPSCLIGLVSMIFVIWCQIHLSNKTELPRKENKKTIDDRVKLTHELIEGIRLIKMYAWEKVFKKKIVDLRQSEHNTFLKMTHIDAIGRNFSSLSVYLNILLICIVYTIVDGVLSPEKVYASMMILMYLSASLVASHQGRMSLVNFKMVTNRVEEVLTIKDVLLIEETLNDNRSSAQAGNRPIVFKDFTAYWSHSAQKPCLSNINYTFTPGSLTAVIGKIGSGKSSLLLSFLRELPNTTGTLDYSGRLAYVEQDPIIFSGTFRENILFGRDYNESLYRQVIKDCRLDKDLEAFPHGDLTLIGERGVNLSGGQKARVSLGRALYSEADIYLLDDPFSALDSKVAREIFNDVLREGMTKGNKTTILVTHHLHFAKESDYVLFMDEGRVEAQGLFSELEKMNIGLLNVFRMDEGHEKKDETTSNKPKKEKKNDQDDVVSKRKERGNREDATQVTWQTYKDYLNVKGSREILTKLIALFLVSHGLLIYFARVLGYWAEEQTRVKNLSDGSSMNSFDHSRYIVLCSVMLGLVFILSYLKTMTMNRYLLSTNSELHLKMLNAIVRANVLFFDINPVGRVLNRFANDLGALDKNNAKMIFELIDGFIGQISLLITVCVINPAIILPAILVMYGLVLTRKQFAKPMTLTKKLELASKSPMLSAVPATLQGLIIIRVYNQGGRFIKEFMDMIYNSVKTYTFLTKLTRLFAFMLDTPIQLLTIAGVWIFIILMFYDNLEPGLVGLSLMYLLKIGSHSTQIIRQSLQVDINMQSAQRILDYCDIKCEAPDHVPQVDDHIIAHRQPQWPQKGEIIFQNVSLRYKEELPLALHGLSLRIPGGTKVGCVGRTGAGKSTIIQALFRMVEIEAGPAYIDSHIKIDDVDISSVGLTLLRSRLAIIPQVPVIFGGTIRRNLDPLQRLDDDELWQVLKEVNLKDYVDSLKDQLDTDITMSTSVFSAGQKQLMCLARAIINKSKVIMLDEATANVDVETDSLIQKTIMKKFKDCTVLTIAHRLITIANYDKVVVVDGGRVVEYESPYKLLVERVGDDQMTKKTGMFAEMVRSTGPSMANKIFEIARAQHEIQSRKLT